MSDRPTPETDAKASPHIGFYSCATVPADFARKLERERDEARAQRDRLAEALRRLLTADIPRPLGGIIDDAERQAAIEWNAFERGEARQHARSVLRHNKQP